ncbi:DUF2252 domain-containing protein [Deminuibacter soli]|nr:DUF2252 domain-containing protein [Deminuibacter soli]
MDTSKMAEGKKFREQLPRKSHALWQADKKRPAVLDFINASNYDRVQQLIPIRHARMNQSPFTFYRGNALIMAHDLSGMPHTNMQVQCIGDCHLMNFGGYATPERSLIFDANDFDETHPAPWEWDLKRLATSFVLAARDKQMKASDAKGLAFTVAQSYRTSMFQYMNMSVLDLWYLKFDVRDMMEQAKSDRVRDRLKQAIVRAEKASHEQVFNKITQKVIGSFEIADQHPLIYHPLDVKKEMLRIREFMVRYLNTIQDDKRFLFEKYEVVDLALKVVGIGSVGTRCMVALMMNDKHEPLFLQIKEARKSVLEAFTQPSKYKHSGERVVQGQRLVQAASDMFLGWSNDSEGRYYYLRQLRDRKIAPDIDSFDKELLTAYARLCGRMLARAHAKTGDVAFICGYMGKSESLDDAISDFALLYADQTERDFQQFSRAIKAGKLEVGEV